MASELSGKVAIITGGASGIGRASAELIVAEGAKVIIADVDEARGQELANRLGANTLFLRTDVSLADDVQALVDCAISHFGGLDVMFNNARISAAPFADFVDDTLLDFDRVMRVNLLGPMLGTRNAARVMKARGGGVILNTASIAGTLAGMAMMTYRASKAGLVHFTKSAAIDLAQYNIRVNCIVPGHVRTELSSFRQPGVSEAAAAEIEAGVDAAHLANQLIKRRGDPEDVAHLALFLASERSRQMTGAVIPVEAGVTVGDPVNHLREILDVRTRAMSKDN